MRLKAKNTFSGALGSASYGQEFDVDEKTGKAMLAEFYPVEAVKERGVRQGAKRAAKTKGGKHSGEGAAQPSED